MKTVPDKGLCIPIYALSCIHDASHCPWPLSNDYASVSEITANFTWSTPVTFIQVHSGMPNIFIHCTVGALYFTSPIIQQIEVDPRYLNFYERNFHSRWLLKWLRSILRTNKPVAVPLRYRVFIPDPNDLLLWIMTSYVTSSAEYGLHSMTWGSTMHYS